MSAATSDGPLTRVLVRFALRSDGSLRSGRLLALAFVGGLVVAIGTTVAIVAADAGNPATLSIWVIVAFLGVKLPLLGLLWWVLGRRQREEGHSDEDMRAMIARLRSATEHALKTPDAVDRLTILAEEARYVVAHASPDVRTDAEAVADLIAALVETRNGSPLSDSRPGLQY